MRFPTFSYSGIDGGGGAMREFVGVQAFSDLKDPRT